MATSKQFFREAPTGTLVAMEPEEFTGAIYHIWFPYARSYMTEVREGGLVAVKNFQSKNSEYVYSILEMVTALPAHFALGTSPSDTEKAFPGFVVEAAKNAKLDWEQEEPVEHTTKIRTEAIPTGLQLIFTMGSEPVIEADTSLPMIGEEAFLLTNEMISMVINRGLTHDGANVIKPCKLSLNVDIDICIKVDDLLRTHFGVFGFTGAGKSNLMSNLMNDLINHKGREPLKIVLFDLMSEYPSILMDILHDNPGAFILSLETDAVIGGDDTIAYLNGNGKIDNAIDKIERTMLLPKELDASRAKFHGCIKKLLESGKIKILDETAEQPDAAELIESLEALIPTTAASGVRPAIVSWLRANMGQGERISFEQLARLIAPLNHFIDTGIITAPVEGVQQGLGGPRFHDVELKAKGVEALRDIKEEVQGMVNRVANPPPKKAALTFKELLATLNSKEGSSLIVVQSDRDDVLRKFAAKLININFSNRRRIGQITPSILFMFDEADEFIPQTVSKEDDSYAHSRAAITTLARRGRKFGMGMAIATQRIAYLDTSIMAQPHTYFISKLPREYDREAMSKAFGITDDMMRKTLKFTKGQWLLVSFDATGLENIPIPVQFKNANARVKAHLEKDHR